MRFNRLARLVLATSCFSALFVTTTLPSPVRSASRWIGQETASATPIASLQNYRSLAIGSGPSDPTASDAGLVSTPDGNRSFFVGLDRSEERRVGKECA